MCDVMAEKRLMKGPAGGREGLEKGDEEKGSPKPKYLWKSYL